MTTITDARLTRQVGREAMIRINLMVALSSMDPRIPSSSDQQIGKPIAETGYPLLLDVVGIADSGVM